ncbi:hypothetical protein SPRG_02551 [Saprolegnia parasitica CBS 223.65]|uniref:Uncharacterized protein n=1 Tax=Saprolegnia parasitica (strain CBS 223.65) TaxID=695850 RepID=A0A067CQS6_SAPPC|nr:hypothetical protein SPRG_02551 [Saprolegnia parasitica CBS 223.65]KDO32858.1 hypothetical protein SPRG_02551 [Saprolegnia parasitica CBS 223.65]|eukprot:XP_012196510.1 hypothetical protein SPRG_02551 [Saprolegnia parasitica CBS 223.65]
MPSAKFEIAVAATLAMAGAMTWKKWATADLQKIDAYYASLKKADHRAAKMPSAKIEIVIASVLGVAGGLVWKRYANSELNKFDAYYAHLKKQNN